MWNELPKHDYQKQFSQNIIQLIYDYRYIEKPGCRVQHLLLNLRHVFNETTIWNEATRKTKRQNLFISSRDNQITLTEFREKLELKVSLQCSTKF